MGSSNSKSIKLHYDSLKLVSKKHPLIGKYKLSN